MSENKKENLPTEFEEICKEALEQINRDSAGEAYSLLRRVLDYPSQIENEDMWQKAFNIFEKIARNLVGDDFGDLVMDIIEDPNHIRSLYDLAYELYEQGVFGIAATLLARANKIEPSNPEIVIELISNFEALMLNHEVCKILSDSKSLIEDNEMCRYLLAYNSLMTGDLEQPLKILPSLKDSQDSDIQYMYKSLKGMLDRAKTLKNHRPLDDKDLRGWHMVLNGSVLLHLSPFGLDDAMYGRYAYISDSYALCREGIDRVKSVLEFTNIEIPYILSMPDRSSTILAMAASKILKKPLKIWDENDILIQGLIVVYDFDQIQSGETLNQIYYHRPGQILWVHASCWTNPFPFAPDITTYLYQQNATPWSGNALIFDKESKQVKTAEPDETSDEEISMRIVNAERDDEYLEDIDDVYSLLEPLRDLDSDSLPGIYRKMGKRLRERTGSPVRSNRFM